MKVEGAATKEELQRRLKRIEGQVRGVQRMLDEDRDCHEIVQQLSAFFSAIVLIAAGFLYYSLVEKKEGAGLLKKVEEIGAPKAE